MAAKHSSALSNKTIAKHFTIVPSHLDGMAVVRYTPKTADAHDHWKTTGICSACLARAISSGRCVLCGFKPTGGKL